MEMPIKTKFDGGIYMSKDMIYRMVFEEIKESCEWSLDCKGETYSYYIDGVISLGQRMLRELDKTVACDDGGR